MLIAYDYLCVTLQWQNTLLDRMRILNKFMTDLSEGALYRKIKMLPKYGAQD
jgi:hypothetical protein